MPKPTLSTGALVDSFSGEGLSGRRIAIGVAAIIYLRWLDFEDAEQEAIALFDGTEFQPRLPAKARWTNWPTPEEGELSSFFIDVMVPGIDDSPAFSHAVRRAVINGLVAFSLDDTLGSTDHGRRLWAAIRWVKGQRLETPRDRRDFLQAYDELLERVQRLDPDGFPRTPTDLARLMAAFARPEPGMQLYDPCFGTAQLLTSALRQARDATPQRDRESPMTTVLSGAEQDPGLYLAGLVRSLLAGAEEPRLWLGNALERPPAGTDASEDGADLILANPPIGERLSLDGLGHYPIQSPDSTVLFVQHVMQQLAEDGRAVVLVPQGFLYRRGKETEVRRQLARNGWVDAVIGLPRRAGGSSSLVPKALLLLSRGPVSGSVRMVDGEGLLKARGYHAGEPLKSDAIKALRETADVVPSEGRIAESDHRFFWDVTREILGGVDWDLTPKRRDSPALEQGLELLRDSTPIQALMTSAEVLSPPSLPASLVRSGPRPPHAVDYIRIGDVQHGEIHGGAGWLHPADLSRGNDEQALRAFQLREGDVLLARSAELDKVALVDYWGSGFPASGFFVLRPRPGVLSGYFLSVYLRSPACRAWLKAKATGGAVGRVPVDALMHMPVPVPAISLQEKVATLFTDHDLDPLTGLLRILDPDAAAQDKAAISQWTGRALAVLDEEGRKLERSEEALPFVSRLLEYPLPVRRCSVPMCGTAYSLRDVDRHAVFGDGNPEYREYSDSMCLDCCSEGQIPASPVDGDEPLIAWCLGLFDALGGLGDLDRDPRDLVRVTLVQLAQLRLKLAASALQASSGEQEPARRLNDEIEQRLAEFTTERYKANRLSFRIDPSISNQEDDQSIIRVRNDGPLPLVHVHIHCHGRIDGTADIEYLKEHEERAVMLGESLLSEPREALDGPVDGGAGSDDPLVGGQAEESSALETVAEWSAVTLSGDRVYAEEPSPVEMNESAIPGQPELLTGDLGASPYVSGHPIDPSRDQIFFGRDEEIAQIRRQIVSSANVVLLEGNRRTGKTSILKHLEGFGPIPGWLAVYSSLQGAKGSEEGVGVPTAEVFRHIAADLAKAAHSLGLNTPLPNGDLLLAQNKVIGIARACRTGISEDDAFADFEQYLAGLVDLLGSQLREDSPLRLVLLLDEFDKLQEGINNGVTSPQVPENIRYLVQNQPGFSAVLTGSRRLKRLREEYWSALFGLGVRVGISELPEEAARRLVTEPVEGRIKYSDAAVSRVLHLTARHPFLVQNLCNRVFDLVARGRSRQVGVDSVDAAADELVEDNEHFATLWDYARTPRRRLVLMICHRAVSRSRTKVAPKGLGFGDLIQALNEAAIDVRGERLEQDIEHLRQCELLALENQTGYTLYHLAIPLMGLWMDRQQDIEGLRVKAISETEEEDD